MVCRMSRLLLALREQHGQSAMEVLLCLPFLLAVMLLGLNFGKGFLLKQKAAVAARYAAWHETRTGRPVNETDMHQAGYSGDQMRLTHLQLQDASGTARGSVQLASGNLSGFLGPFWGRLRGGTAYSVSYTWQPLGRVLQEGHPTEEIYIVIEDWRCGRGGGDYVSGVGVLVGALSRFLGSVFITC